MPRYDVVIVGAGIAGPALAHGLSTLPRTRKPRIALLERSLAEPDRIIGELLQPAGVTALHQLGLEGCLEGLDAIPVRGYCALHSGKLVHIPYPNGYEGRSFHHGRFVMSLRAAAKRAEGVELIEATATELIEYGGRVVGVKATQKMQEEECKEEYYADIVIMADGSFSNFRSSVMGCALAKPVTNSYFCGVILEDVTLPMPKHGTAALIQGSGPVLMYQISERQTRLLISIKHPLPADLKVRYHLSWILDLFSDPHFGSHISSLVSSPNYQHHSIQPSTKHSTKTVSDACHVPSSLQSYKVPPHLRLVSSSLVMRGICDIPLLVVV